jgi:hypothetical protein
MGHRSVGRDEGPDLLRTDAEFPEDDAHFHFPALFPA